LLEEAEFAFFWGLFQECAGRLAVRLMQESSAPREGVVAAFYRPFLEEYEQRTGFHEVNPKAFLHHLRSNFGPPCQGCGRLLRTPRASKCMECGTPKGDEQAAAVDRPRD
jgi:hypothetical protein